jgi:hypothetical protein
MLQKQVGSNRIIKYMKFCSTKLEQDTFSKFINYIKHESTQEDRDISCFTYNASHSKFLFKKTKKPDTSKSLNKKEFNNILEQINYMNLNQLKECATKIHDQLEQKNKTKISKFPTKKV